MAFIKNGETKVFKQKKPGFVKKVAQTDETVRYTTDDLMVDSEKGIDPYEAQKEADVKIEKKEKNVK